MTYESRYSNLYCKDMLGENSPCVPHGSTHLTSRGTGSFCSRLHFQGYLYSKQP